MDIRYGRGRFSVRDGVIWTFGTAEAAFLYGTGLYGHSVRQTLVFCTGQGYMDIPYSRGRFSVRDGVTWTFRTADPCFLYGTGLLWPLYGTLWGLPYRKEPLFCTGRAPGHASQTGPGGKTPHKAFFARPPATGNGEQLTILFFMPNFEPLFISTVNDNRRTGPAGHP